MVLDPGSQRSYVTNRVKDALQLRPEGNQHIAVVTFGSNQRNSQDCEIVRIRVKFKDGSDKEFKLFAVPLICQPVAAQPIKLCMERFRHLSQLDLADFSDGTTPMNVDMLIGADYYWELTTGETSRGDAGAIAIHTRLGWVLSGPAPAAKSDKRSFSLVTTHTLHVGNVPCDTKSLNDTLQSFWDLESLGIKEPDRSVFTEFEESIQFRDGRYQVSLPWKDPHPVLPDNYQLCVKRLHGLLRRLRQDPNMLDQYDSIIRDQIKQGIVQPVEPQQTTVAGKVHYLPHHAVIRRDKETTKLRIVYDASARSDGPSLNNCLYTGPKFDQRIMDILQRFRTYKVALAADIEKAFLMVSMSEGDRDVLRFLWIDDVLKDNPSICIFRFTRVVFGVSSSPFLLNATIKHHLNEYSRSHPQLVKTLSQSTYVDDIISGAKSDDDAFLLYKESKSLLKEGGFNLRKFITNSSQLQKRIDEDEGVLHACKNPELEETYTRSTLGTNQSLRSGEQKILGVRWNVLADHLVIDVSNVAHLARELEPTKRHIVSVVGRFYDPLGFISPVVIQFKILFQELCRTKLDWDEPLDGELLRKWRSLISDLQDSPTVSIPRHFLSGICSEVKSYSLHGFCDASKDAYAAVVYLLIETTAGLHVRFVASKTRVTPVHEQTIPRLELLSALLLSRLVTSVTTSLESELPLSQPTCYTDSKVTLYWITGSEREWKQFVQNRVSEIRKLLPLGTWKHVAGKDNPADLPSRGLAVTELSVNKLWREGPDWLREGEILNAQENTVMPEECISEMKALDRKSTLNLLVTEERPSLSQILHCEQYSTIRRLLRVTAYVVKFVRLLKQKTQSSDTSPSTVLTATEISDAEMLWVKEAQALLVKNDKFDCWKKQFNLFLDAYGIWRCGGRISNADVPYATKHPILLPKGHHLTSLIVLRAHERVHHDGTRETLTEVRSRYWIVQGRSVVKMVLRNCTLCQKFEGKPYLAPPPPPLPKFRVREEPPFSCTGVDFAGPFYVKTSGTTAVSKVWLCLYTCCIVRAVHLDIVPDLTTESFLRSFKRFSARRGLPRKMISDNGKTFKAASKSLEKLMSHDEVQQHLSGVGIEWLFNVEKAPWWGGLFERMVRSAKRCLKKIIGRAKLNYDELLTAVTEAEMIINSRPLTYISSDDVEAPLTPSHFLMGRRTLSVPDSLLYQCEDDDDDVTITHEQLNKRMRHLNVVLNQFWKRWQREYLLELREAHQYSSGNSDACSAVSIGDIVLVHDDKPRGFWRLARIENVITGRDGQIRRAILRVAS